MINSTKKLLALLVMASATLSLNASQRQAPSWTTLNSVPDRSLTAYQLVASCQAAKGLADKRGPDGVPVSCTELYKSKVRSGDQRVLDELSQARR